MAARGFFLVNDRDILEDFTAIEGDYFDLSRRELDPADTELEEYLNVQANIEEDSEQVEDVGGVEVENAELELDTELNDNDGTYDDTKTLKELAGCKCAKECISLFQNDHERIELGRIVYCSMNKEKYDIAILSKVSTFVNNSELTRCTQRKEQTARKNSRCIYTFEGNLFMAKLFSGSGLVCICLV